MLVSVVNFITSGGGRCFIILKQIDIAMTIPGSKLLLLEMQERINLKTLR